MKSAALVVFCIFTMTSPLLAQQEKKQIPKVNLDKFTPPAESKAKARKISSKNNKHIPKVDLTNFKPPAKTHSGRKKE